MRVHLEKLSAAWFRQDFPALRAKYPTGNIRREMVAKEVVMLSRTDTNSTNPPESETQVTSNVDGLQLESRSAEVACPNQCGELHFGQLLGVKVVGCPVCRGMLVESVAFGHLVEVLRADYRGADSLPTPLDPQQLEIERRCPACYEPLEVHPYFGPGAVVIDSCIACNLIWLDASELTRITRAPGKR